MKLMLECFRLEYIWSIIQFIVTYEISYILLSPKYILKNFIPCAMNNKCPQFSCQLEGIQGRSEHLKFERYNFISK